METKFQTSFIPKKSLGGPEKSHSSGGTSIFMTLAVILFIASLAAAGVTFFLKSHLISTQAADIQALNESQQRFNTTKIEELAKTSTKIKLAEKILNNHLSVSQVFSIIGGLTIDGVRFSSLQYTAPDPASQDPFAKISMKGIANSFSSIAWQSDVLGKSDKYGTNIALKNPVLSDLSVDTDGNVGFSFAAEIDPSLISYEKVLKQTLQAEGAIPSTPGTAASSTTP